MTSRNQYFPKSVPHPGSILEEKLQEMKMRPGVFAFKIKRSEHIITAIIDGRQSITSDIAVQFENVTMIPASYWMNHQRLHDESITRNNKNKKFFRKLKNLVQKNND